MKSALVTLTFKYTLDQSATHLAYSTIYSYCKSEFSHLMGQFNSNRYANITNYNDLPTEGKQRINNGLTSMVRSLPERAGLDIPSFTDESGLVKFELDSISHQIEHGDTQTGEFSMFLFYQTGIFTLVDSIGDKLVLAFGDKSKELMNGTEFPVFFLKVTPTVWFNSYKRI